MANGPLTPHLEVLLIQVFLDRLLGFDGIHAEKREDRSQLLLGLVDEVLVCQQKDVPEVGPIISELLIADEPVSKQVVNPLGIPFNRRKGDRYGMSENDDEIGVGE